MCPLCEEEAYCYGVLRSQKVRDQIFGRMELCHSSFRSTNAEMGTRIVEYRNKEL
jgi:hypothetical protein